MKVFLEFMKPVAEWFEDETYHGGGFPGRITVSLQPLHCLKSIVVGSQSPSCTKTQKTSRRIDATGFSKRCWTVSFPTNTSLNGERLLWSHIVSSTLSQPLLPTQIRTYIHLCTSWWRLSPRNMYGPQYCGLIC